MSILTVNAQQKATLSFLLQDHMLYKIYSDASVLEVKSSMIKLIHVPGIHVLVQCKFISLFANTPNLKTLIQGYTD